MQNNDIDKPVYVVLGATGGIGSVLCQNLAEKGARVLAAARNQEKLELLANKTGISPFLMEATNPNSIDRAIKSALEFYQKIDGVANCIGSILLKPVHITIYLLLFLIKI
ncbi:MAG: SDR family NAD(P)-dependent oxidoreductase [Blastocatellia bacterium]